MMKKLQILQAGSIQKMLFLSVTAGLLSVGVQAQNKINGHGTLVRADKKFAKHVEPVNQTPNANKVATPLRPATYASPSAKAMVVSKVDIATSANIFGSLLSDETLLDYNPLLDVISYTNRKAIGIVPPISNSGIIQSHISFNKGGVWDTTRVVLVNSQATPLPGVDSVHNRYPSGVIVNPPGNTTPSSAYTVCAAPMLRPNSDWDGGTFGSLRMDNLYNSQVNIANATAAIPQWMPRIGMCSGTNGNAYVVGADYDYNSSATVIPFGGVVINRGVWNAANNNFDWDQKKIYHAFSRDPSDSSQNNSTLGNVAFSADGVTGYVVIIGRDSLNDHLSPMPIIYRTIDAGNTWSFYSALDYTPLFVNTLPPNDDGFMRPFWYNRNSSDLSVDAYGKLHILSEIGIAATNHPDSLNYLNSFGTLFDVYETAAGTWNQILVGQLYSEPDAITTAGGTNTFGWTVDFDGRAQICRSADGLKMSYLWMETDTLINAKNLYPNIKGSSADFSTLLATDEVNFTEGGAYDANNYWMCVSGTGWDNSGTNVIPVVTSRLLNLPQTGDNSTFPWMHEWVGGISFAPAEYVNTIVLTGVNENPVAINGISVYPNPSKDLTNLSIDLKANASVNVSIVNSIGQTVKNFDLGNANAGMNSFQLDISSLSNGIYVIQMNIGGEMATRLLSVQN